MESLQVKTIKTAFGAINRNEQIKLIQDLMVDAKIHSIIGDNDDALKDNFVEYIIPFLAKNFSLIETHHIDDCCKIWDIIEKNSFGDGCGSLCEVGGLGSDCR